MKVFAKNYCVTFLAVINIILRILWANKVGLRLSVINTYTKVSLRSLSSFLTILDFCVISIWIITISPLGCNDPCACDDCSCHENKTYQDFTEMVEERQRKFRIFFVYCGINA